MKFLPGYTRVNAHVFENAINGYGVFCVRNPQELYNLYELFQDTYYNFFNLNILSREELLIRSFRNEPELFGNILNIPEELFKDSLITQEQHIFNMVIYYYLTNNYGFKGFPAYFHIRDAWDDSKYELNDEMSRKMGLSKDNMKQVELLYESGVQLGRVNRINTLTFTRSIDVVTSMWKFETDSMEETSSYTPPRLRNTIKNEICYPICFLDDASLGGIRTMKQEMRLYTSCQTNLNKTSLMLSNALAMMLVVDDPFNNKSQKEIAELVNHMMRFTFEGVPLKVYNREDLALIDTFLAFFCGGPTESINLMENIELGPQPEESFPMYLLNQPGEYSVKYFYDIGEGNSYYDFNEIREIMNESNMRLMFLMNCAQRLLCSLPMLGTYVPPRFIMSVWNMMLSELNQDTKEDSSN